MKTKIMLLLAIFGGLQGSQSELKKSLLYVVDKYPLRDRTNACAIHWFKPEASGDPFDQMDTQVKKVIEELHDEIREEFRPFFQFIGMMNSQDLSKVDVFDLRSNEWSKREMGNQDNPIRVLNVVNDEPVVVWTIKQLRENGVPLVINMMSTIEGRSDIVKAAGEGVVVFGDAPESQKNQKEKTLKDQDKLTTQPKNHFKDQDKLTTQPKNHFFVVYKNYIFGLTAAGLLAAFLYHKDFLMSRMFAH